MQHNFDEVFDTSSPYWQRVLEIFDKNEKYEKKIVSGRNLHHKFPRSFSKMLNEPADNDKDNLISLSLSDHFLVHYYYYLLARKGYRQRMATAFTFMAKKSLKFMAPDTAEAMAKDYEEARTIANQHISESMKGENNPQYGRRSPWKGKHPTDETRKKMSESMKGENNPNYGKTGTMTGKHHSEETRRKLSALRKGKHWKLVDGKRVYY